MDKIERGKEVLENLWGLEIPTNLAAFLERSKKGLGDYFFYSYGEFYGDETLDLKTKQLLVITALITQKWSTPQLRNHVLACKNVGLTKREVMTAILHLTLYIGFPAVINSFEIINDVYT